MATDTRVVRLVVNFVGMIGVLSIVGIFALILADKSVPDPLWGIPVGAVTGLVGLLASTRSVDVKGLQELADANGNGKKIPASTAAAVKDLVETKNFGIISSEKPAPLVGSGVVTNQHGYADDPDDLIPPEGPDSDD